MKKVTVLLAILALVLMTAPVLADCLPGCEVVNGNFSSALANPPWALSHSSNQAPLATAMFLTR